LAHPPWDPRLASFGATRKTLAAPLLNLPIRNTRKKCARRYKQQWTGTKFPGLSQEEIAMTIQAKLTQLFCAALFAITCTAHASNHKALEEALKAKYAIAKTGLDRARITQPGTVLVIQKDGISGDLATDLTFLNNKVRDGQVAQAGGFGAFMQDKKTSRILKTGDKVYVFNIQVKDDQVRYFVITCDTYDVDLHGSTRQTRYKALLSFEFPKEFLSNADADAVKKVVDTVIEPEQEAKAASTKSVDLGQSPEQVEAILGKPDKIVNLGPKTIYVYKDMKIIFLQSKVSDVQ
jgi:hypothetical protein